MRDLVLGAHALRRCAGAKGLLVGLLSVGLVGACSPFENVSANSPAIRSEPPDSGGPGADDAGPPDAAIVAPLGVAPDRLVPKGDCFLRKPPLAPEADDVDPDGEDVPELFLAAHNIHSGDELDDDGEPVWKTIGYDTDDECSTEPMSHACSVAQWATPGAMGSIDGEDGVDNAVGAAFRHISEEGSGSATTAGNDFANAGLRTYVVQVRGYNGQANDSDVTLSTFAVTFASTPGAQSAKPLWTGGDEWLGYDTFFNVDSGVPEGETLPPPKFAAERAYVVQHRLVAYFPDVLSVHGTFSRLVVTGTLREREGLGWVLDDAVMAGRVMIDNLLQILDTTNDPTHRERICIGHPLYAGYKAVFCSLGDVSYTGADEQSSLCDGVSWAWSFDAVPAKVVGVQTYEPFFFCPEGKRPGVDDHCDPDLEEPTEGLR